MQSKKKKVCRVCGKSEPEVDFEKGRIICRICRNAQRSEKGKKKRAEKRIPKPPKICKDCGKSWPEVKFEKGLRCSKCYYQRHREKTLEYQRQWSKLPEQLKKSAADMREYRAKNSERVRATTRRSYQKNKGKYRRKKRVYEKKKIKEDPIFALRKKVSQAVYQALKKKDRSKGGRSILQFLPYTMQELHEWIEKQFSAPENLTSDGKIWMTWKNWGRYDPKTWIEDDFSTHTWQVDHIIPQARFPYESMDSPLFQECWALKNLRPYSSKLNTTERDRKSTTVQKEKEENGEDQTE